MAWRDVDGSVKRGISRAVVLLDGGDKDGKTTMALTAPTPIWFLNTNFGYEGLPAYEALKAQGLIKVADHALPAEYVMSNYEKVMNDINADYNAALKAANEVGGTVVIDKGDEVWAMVGPVMKAQAEQRRFQEHVASGKDPAKFKKMQTDYQDPNLWMRSFVLRGLQYPNVNVIFVHGTKREWKDDGSGPTGKLLYHGFSETPGLVQAHVRVTLPERQMILKDGIPTGRFTDPQTEAQIMLCRFDRKLQGFKLDKPTWTSFMEAVNE